MNIIKIKEYYFSKILDDLGMFDIVDLLDKMVSFVDVEYSEVYDPYFDLCEIDIHLDNFIECFDRYKNSCDNVCDELIELYEISLKHRASGEEELYLEF